MDVLLGIGVTHEVKQEASPSLKVGGPWKNSRG